MIYGIRKRMTAALLAGALMSALGACGSSQENVRREETAAAADSVSAADREESVAGEDNILIAYFTAGENSGVDAVSSASYITVDGEAVGRLRAVADMIQDKTGGELFSIRTSVVYPTDGGELIDYAAQEQDENARPELTSHIDNFEQYDIVFVGYPKMEQGYICV